MTFRLVRTSMIVPSLMSARLARAVEAVPMVVATGSHWPFTFAETLTLITTITASIVTVISLFRIEKVHTIVNSNQTKQEQKIADLQAALTSERTINELAEGVRKALARETAANLVESTTASSHDPAQVGQPPSRTG